MKKVLLSTVLFLFVIGYISAQSISGVVTNSKTNRVVKGVEITVSPTNKNLKTDSLGKYQISLPAGVYNLFFFKEGFSLTEKTVTISNKNEVLNISLNPSDVNLDEVTVFATPTKPTKRIDDALHTGTEITLKGLETAGVVANNSIFQTLNIVPSVITQSTDAYGLGDNIMRVRGVRSQYTGMTIEGIPNYGLSPIGAREDIYEKENLQSVSLYKGAVPADVFSGSGNRGGSIDLSIKRSSKEWGTNLHQAFGTDAYSRTFFRFDTGELNNGKSTSSAFISLSYTTADKWKGFGKLAERKNLSVGFTHKFNDKLKLELFSVYNNNFRHDFKKFKHAEIIDFDKNYNADFINLKDKSLAEYRSYYDYNKSDRTNLNTMLLLSYDLDDNNSFAFKTYYAKEDGVRNFTVGSPKAPKLKELVNDFWQAGAILSYNGNKGDFNYSAGYWFEVSDNQGYNFWSKITPNGLSKNKKTDIFVEPTQLGDFFHTPYAKLAYSKNGFKAQVGLKYMAFNSRGSVRYFPANFPNGGGTGEVKADKPTEDIGSKPRINDAWLPSAGLGYKFSNNLEAYVNYGRGYMRQYSGVTGAYLKNRPKFLNAGYTFQTLLDQFKTETSDNFDLGIIFNSKKFKFKFNAFYAKQNNVLVNVMNPVFDVVYRQNVGKATGYGAELESYFKIIKGLTFYANPSYNNYSYDEDLNIIVKGKKTVVEIKGKQAPAVPKFMVKSGLIYNYENFNANASVTYTGERFGDATNLEKLDAFTLFDFSANYKFNLGSETTLSLGAEVKNLLGKKYVGMITSSDEQRKGGTAYYYGSPRVFLGSLRLTF
ncbi:MAG: TonB-dependent receptor [Tenacibaculum sp.]|nr:TonB-dependent receptor [Tenacibaculum sp.]